MPVSEGRCAWSGRVAGVDSVGALGLLVGGRLFANERTNLLVGALWGQGLCERTNKRRRRGCVRSFGSSAGYGAGLHRHVRSFAMFAAKRGSGERTFVRSFVGARDVPKSWWSGRWVEGRRGGWACCKCVTTPHKLCYPLTSTSGGFISRLQSRSGEPFKSLPEPIKKVVCQLAISPDSPSCKCSTI